jgi:hypothetical protein
MDDNKNGLRKLLAEYNDTWALYFQNILMLIERKGLTFGTYSRE